MSQKFEKLKTLLKELFQLDKPDLDFGIYRILHARAAEVSQFLDRDLLPQVQAAFAGYRGADKVALEKELAEAEQQARSLGVEPDQSPKVQQLRQRLKSDAVDIGTLESEVYDHLYSFFRRYYSEGDFLSKRVYKPGVYAIPYEGEEVKLHWANADQYYIKTSEYLRDYAFRLRPEDDARPMRVHLRLQDAAEGEPGNVKEAEGKERRFILVDTPPSVEDGELVIRFTYRPDPEGRKQKELNEQAEARLLALDDASFADWLAELRKPHIRSDGTSSDSTRLRVHLDRYTARNTFDYFIHKDLGGFLRRELDFYIKNEVMHLDDVEAEAAPRVEQYLSKIKVIRGISSKIIDFLAQTENLQARLWKKKKFCTDVSYIISIDRIPVEMISDIVSSANQALEWKNLFGVDVASFGGGADDVAAKIKTEFPFLSIDTRHFSNEWRDDLISRLEDMDREVTGFLFHSDNLQALRLMDRRFHGRVEAAYLDPPYNTDAAPISYKNGYRSSSWISMIRDRVAKTRDLLSETGILCITIDDYQYAELRFLMDEIFGSDKVVGTIAIRSNPSGRPTPAGLAQSHEYALFAKASSGGELGRLPRSEAQARRYRQSDDDGAFMWELFRKRGSGSERADRRTLYYPIYVSGSSVRVPEMRWNEASRDWIIDEPAKGDETVVWPIDENGIERRWRGSPDRIRNSPEDFKAELAGEAGYTIYYKFRPRADGVVPSTVWIDARYSATEYGTGALRAMFSDYNIFDFPKSVLAVEDCLRLANLGEEREGTVYCVDCFGGSGTTGHAVINLNRADGGDRRFVLIEAEKYFDTVLTPRLRKAAYSANWQNAKPNSHNDGVSVFWKCVRLETYEDALSNLHLERPNHLQSLLDHAASQGPDGLREQYVLRYMLDVESRGSASLLNIQAFTDPTSYRLTVKRPGSDESREVCVDLIETFNWLVGLAVKHYGAPHSFAAAFKRDGEGRLGLDGRLRPDAYGPFWFRTVTGATPEGRKALVIWRKLTGNAEQDNLVLDEWFTRQGYSSKDSEFDIIYVNGDNNLENLKAAEDLWKVRLIEEDFHRLMFAEEG